MGWRELGGGSRRADDRRHFNQGCDSSLHVSHRILGRGEVGFCEYVGADNIIPNIK